MPEIVGTFLRTELRDEGADGSVEAWACEDGRARHGGLLVLTSSDALSEPLGAGVRAVHSVRDDTETRN
jgi:hypothetical protein